MNKIYMTVFKNTFKLTIDECYVMEVYKDTI